MPIRFRIMSLLCLILACRMASAGTPVDAATRARVVDAFADKLVANYVSRDVGASAAAQLRAALARGDYDRVDGAEAFAQKLASIAREATHDQHLNVMFMKDPVEPDNSPHVVVNRTKTELPGYLARMDRMMRAAAQENFGFGKVERLDGNIGYVPIGSFYEPALAGLAVASELSQFADASALIVDLRGNGGGSMDTVALVAAYLFDDKPMHLADRHTRGWSRTEAIWTSPVASDLRFGSAKPVYILVDKETFSAAEGFAYTLQALGRAIVVGERTAGGAHRARGFRLDEHFLAAIPHAVTLSPVTHRDWEGVGVVPDVAVAADKALETARALALKAVRERLARGG